MKDNLTEQFKGFEAEDAYKYFVASHQKSEYVRFDNDREHDIITRNSAELLSFRIEKMHEDLKGSMERHDSKMDEDHALLKDKMDELKRENQYFRQELSKIYNPNKLKKNTLYFASGALASIALSVYADIDLVHPFVSYAILFSAIIFHVMSLVMKKQDSEA